MRTSTKQQPKKKVDVKITPVRVNPPRASSKKQVFDTPDSPDSKDTDSPMNEPSSVITFTATPSKEKSPIVQKVKQAEKTSSDVSEMIATLIRENKVLQEKLNAINSKENTAPTDNRDVPDNRIVPDKNYVPDDRSASDNRHVPDGRWYLLDDDGECCL